jgi:predicted outer membrane repeat protein
MYNGSGSLSLANCTFSGNLARWGGAVRSGCGRINNCTFLANSAESGGGIYAGGCFTNGGELRIANCTFSGNTSIYGGAIRCGEYSGPSVVNCILWGDNATHGPEIAMTCFDWGSSLSN